ncbi:hypothetical protein F5Y15DRAFT_405904 [Xylariaceae sp. FL0016]|nr:hypothetical protein F5Y15DRAFT_405904 [Xylariaceae sp. FL0016]
MAASSVRAVRTCTECKQSKVRCDSKERFPNPCSRCELRHSTCAIDPTFKRTPARKRFEAMSKELSELRIRQAVNVRATSTTSTDSAYSQEPDGNTGPTPAFQDYFSLASDSVLESRIVTIPSQVATEAFGIFASHFHPRLPILGPISAETIYHSSNFLFWSIISVVASNTTIPSSPSLFERIKTPFQDMVSKETLRAPLPLETIQALLILCTWPLPVQAQHDDPGWICCGIAVNSALYLGLHRPNAAPSRRAIDVQHGTPQSRAMTWLGCFHVASNLSMHLGLPSPISSPSDLAVLTTFLSEHPVPRDFASEIRLQIVSTSFTSILSHSSNDGIADASMLQLLDQQLASLSAEFPDQWSQMLEYNTLIAKAYIYTLLLFNGVPSATRDILLRQILSASTRTIELAHARFSEPTPGARCLFEPQFARALPRSYFRGLAFATAYLLRYSSVMNKVMAEQQQIAASHVMLSHRILKQYSVSAEDEYVCVASLFEKLCQHAPVTSSVQHAVGSTARYQSLRVPNIRPEMVESLQQDAFGAISSVASQPSEPWATETTFLSNAGIELSWDSSSIPEVSIHPSLDSHS